MENCIDALALILFYYQYYNKAADTRKSSLCTICDGHGLYINSGVIFILFSPIVHRLNLCQR